MLKFSIAQQIIRRVDGSKPVSSSVNYLKAEFTFQTSEWTGLNKTAIFSGCGYNKQVILDSDGTCIVPWETIQTAGTLTVTVFAGELITVNKAEVVIYESGYNDITAPEDPTPTVYEQIITRLDATDGEIAKAKAAAEAAETSATDAATSATTATTKAAESANSATSAATSANNATTASNSAVTARNEAVSAQAAVETAKTETTAQAAAAAESASTAGIYANEAKTAKADAETAKQTAQAAAATAQAYAGNANTAKTAAEAQAKAAEQSAADAATILAETKTVKDAAIDAKTGAETAKSGAETAKAGAEAAQTKAETAASTATTKAGEAATSAEAAQTSAESIASQDAQITTNTNDIASLKEDLATTKKFLSIQKTQPLSATSSANGSDNNLGVLISATVIKGHTYIVRLRGEYDYGSSSQCTLYLAYKGTSQGTNYWTTIAEISHTNPKASVIDINVTVNPTSTKLDYGVVIRNGINNANNAKVENVVISVVDITDMTDEITDDFYRAMEDCDGDILVYPNKLNRFDIIDCYGDSLTVGVGGSGTTYPSELSALIGTDYYVNNYGDGGEHTLSISSRLGSILASVEPFSMASAGTSVSVTVKSLAGMESYNLTGVKNLNPVRINGVKGLLLPTDTSSGSQTCNFYMLPTETAQTINRPTAIKTHGYNTSAFHTLILWMGQNGGWTGSNPNLMLTDEYRQAERFLNHNHYLFIGLTTGTADSRNTLEFSMGNAFGEHYVNMRKYLVNYGLSDNNLTPTEEDETAIAQGSVPPSLLYDSVHLNAYGYKSVAKCIYQRGKDLGYWS